MPFTSPPVKRFFALFAVCTVVACSRPATPVAVQPAPAPEEIVPLPAGTDLSGTWATGIGTPPALPVITLHPECTHHPAAWLIKQTGNTIESWMFPESYDQGIAVKGPGVSRIVASPGVISGMDVTIDDDSYRYRLRYDPESQQLRGTRDGAPFWAVRQKVVRTSLCPGVP